MLEIEAHGQANRSCVQGFEQLNLDPTIPSDKPQVNPFHSFQVDKSYS